MKVIDNKVKPFIPEWPKTLICRNCGSKLEFEQSDIIKGTMVYSQREIDYGVQGVTCPCCNQFTAL